jgi:septum formation protein
VLVLASASPRRQELLRSAGISFTVQPANVDETVRAGESPRSYAERLAQEKALAVWKIRSQDLVLGADTIVVTNEMILGKPRDAEDAARMLRLLSGRVHQVITGVCLVGPGVRPAVQVETKATEIAEPDAVTASETTLVSMSEISEEEMQAYIATREPMDKAGAYAIQGMASRWIPRIEGDYSNVVGLPLAMVCRMLRSRAVG